MRASITRLARSGSLERAWALFAESGLGASDDPRALTLKARLVKDRAKRASGAEAAQLFSEAASIYERAARPGQLSYPLINAATLSLLAGKHGRARQLARRVIEALDADPDEAETPYWLSATRAEALLLLGNLPEARAALRGALAVAPRAWEDHAATIGQFQLICEELEHDTAWLDQFRPPRSLQYSGIMAIPQADVPGQSRIAEWLEAENVGSGFGALAAGTDIWVAEALVARGASLNVVLPCPVEAFRERSVAAVNQAWLPRFDRLLQEADSVDELDNAPGPSPAAVRLTDAVALGLAVHNARILQSEPLRLRVGNEQRARAGPGHIRLMSLAVARQSGRADFHVGESGAARAILRAGSEDRQVFDSPSEAWAAAQPLIAGGKAIALDYGFVDAESPPEELLSRLDVIAEIAEAGQALASKAMAFALLAEVPELHVETMGEVRASGGFLPLYALV